MKRTAKLLLSAVAIILMLSLSAFAEMYKTNLSTSNSNWGFDLEIKEDKLIVSGTVENEDAAYFLITADKNYLVNITPEVKFIAEISLSEMQKSQVNLALSLGTDVTKPFTSIFFGNDITLVKKDTQWSFLINDRIFDNNTLWQKGYINPKDHLNPNITNAVKLVTSSVIENIDTDYEKTRAIHKWVSDNIYYDNDYATNKTEKTSLTPNEVLTSRVTVCEGYANLTLAMLNSAGIPAVLVKGYALGVGVPYSWDIVPENPKPNHAWVEAFVDGRWITLDPTWDSRNIYENGKKIHGETISYRYFDVTSEMLSVDHMITYRPNLFGLDGISSWAEEEVILAVEEKLVLDEHTKTLKDSITRKEFCDLVVNFVSVKLNKSTDEILTDRELEINPTFFKDTADYNILVANALGIVFGKENNMFDPEGLITRQEAAVMLMRVSKVLGVEKPNSEEFTFSDADSFPEWSRDAIAFVSASISQQGMKVMGGVEDNKFNPTGFYTKEQSILTIHRLFNTY